VSASRTPGDPLLAGRIRLVGLAMVASVTLFATVALAFAGASERELDEPAAWVVAGAALLILGAGTALDGPEPGRKIAALAAREAAGLIGAVLTFLTGSWMFAAALGAMAVVSLLLALPARAPDRPR